MKVSGKMDGGKGNEAINILKSDPLIYKAYFGIGESLRSFFVILVLEAVKLFSISQLISFSSFL